MAILQATKPKASSGVSRSGRLFLLELSGDRIHSMNPDGSDHKVIVTDCQFPDGIAIDARAGHIYWTNMGANPAVNDGSIERADLDGKNRRITVSLTRTLLWLYSLGIFDKAYAQATAGSSDEHAVVAPDLFTAQTPLGTYQGVTDQVVLSRTPGSFKTVLVPRGSSKPEWLPR